MTREEKSNLLNELLEYEEKNDIGNLTRADRREFQQWISEALEQEPCDTYIKEIDHLRKYIYKLETQIVEQEPILDKIRAEIEEAQTYDGIYIDRAYVLQILDKYKAESENT